MKSHNQNMVEDEKPPIQQMQIWRMANFEKKNKEIVLIIFFAPDGKERGFSRVNAVEARFHYIIRDAFRCLLICPFERPMNISLIVWSNCVFVGFSL